MELTTLAGNFGHLPVVSGSPDLIDIKLIDSLFRAFGVVLFTDTGADLDQFNRFAGLFGTNTGIRDVFVGRPVLGWHAEYAYLPMRPAILWFYCVRPAEEGGETKLVDGVRLAGHMSQDLKRSLTGLLLQFNMRLSQPDWELWIGKKDASEASAHLNGFLGMRAHAESSNSIAFQYTTSAFYTTQFSGEIAFTNTLMHAVDDPEHYGLRMADPFASAKLLCELNDLADRFALSIGWQEQQFVMIDNTRFMHARSKYLGSARDVKYLCTYQYRTPAGI